MARAVSVSLSLRSAAASTTSARTPLSAGATAGSAATSAAAIAVAVLRCAARAAASAAALCAACVAAALAATAASSAAMSSSSSSGAATGAATRFFLERFLPLPLPLGLACCALPWAVGTEREGGAVSARASVTPGDGVGDSPPAPASTVPTNSEAPHAPWSAASRVGVSSAGAASDVLRFEAGVDSLVCRGRLLTQARRNWRYALSSSAWLGFLVTKGMRRMRGSVRGRGRLPSPVATAVAPLAPCSAGATCSAGRGGGATAAGGRHTCPPGSASNAAAAATAAGARGVYVCTWVRRPAALSGIPPPLPCRMPTVPLEAPIKMCEQRSSSGRQEASSSCTLTARCTSLARRICEPILRGRPPPVLSRRLWAPPCLARLV